jgi:hypothetical protein
LYNSTKIATTSNDMLCSNRPEGFVSIFIQLNSESTANKPQGPHSHLSCPIPATCFIDTVIIPLPIWLALFLLPLLLALSLHHRKQNFDPSTAHIRSIRSRSCAFITVQVLYYLLIIANILMQTLEIVRLELIHFGIGLLPFSYVGLLLGAGLHWSEGFRGCVRGWQGINAVLWTGGMAVSVVKVVGLSNEGINGRKGSKYPVSDQVIDVAVMAGVYAVIMVLEVGLRFWRAARRAGGRKESLQSGSVNGNGGGMSPGHETTEFVGKYPSNQ